MGNAEAKKTVRTGTTALYAALSAAICTATAPSPATVRSFAPCGDEDRTAEVLAAVKSGATLRFAGGDYHFRSPAKLRFYISNHDNPQPHSVFLPVTNVTDFAMHGDGAVFVFHGSGIGMTVMDTRRVTLKGIAFEWARPPFSEAKVVKVDDGGIVLRPDPVRFPLAVEKGGLVAVGEGWRNRVTILQAFADGTLDPLRGIRGMGKATALGDGTVRLETGRPKRYGLHIGDVALLRSPYRPSPGVSLCRAHDTLIEDCSWHGGDGMGLVAQRCENVMVRGSGKASDRTSGAFARKGSGCATALQADATHFSNCKGRVLVENCFFQGTADDAINVHSTALRIEGVPKPDTLVCRYMHHQSTGFEVFLPGERLRFIKAATLEPGFETVVKDARITDPRHVTITLEDSVPRTYAPGDAVENADWQPSVVFRNNIVRKIMTRAVLLTTPGKSVVEGNLFDRIPSQAIQLEGDASGWYESGACRDVTIRNNVFRDCAFMRGEGIIQIKPNLKDVKEQRERYHRNIVIERNRFETPRIPLLRAHSVSNLVWRDNAVIYNDTFPARGNGPFAVDCSEQVEIREAGAAAGADVVKSLAGEWRVTGENLSGVVRLPGTLADAKLGRRMTAADWEADTDRRSKGALTREYQYVGRAVYEREIELTEEEARHPLELVMERVMLHSELAIDGEAVGSCDSLATEHVYPIPQRLTKAGRHTIRLTLDNSNRYNFSGWAHSYGPVMQSVWHGVVGEFALRRQSALRKARVFASWPANGKLAVEVPEGFEDRGSCTPPEIGGRDKRVPPEKRTIFTDMGGSRLSRPRFRNCLDRGNVRLRKCGSEGTDIGVTVVSKRESPYRKGFTLLELKLDCEPEPWSEHHPNLYVLELRDGAACAAHPPYQTTAHQIRFGFRSVSAHDRAIWINGFKWFMRGNLDCCHFPLTGAPDTTKAWWLETFRRLRDEDGVNAIRFHSWTPPKAAFDAADELGLCFAVEAGIWQDRWMKSTLPGNGGELDAYIRRELRAILESRGNSPSFLALGIGNELGGDGFNTMGKWMDDCKAFDPRRLYFASTAQYEVNGILQRVSGADDYFTISGRGGKWRGRRHPFTDWDYETGYTELKLPAVAHEIGQWPIYVDWEHELAKYTGVLRPYNLEHFRDLAEKSGTKRFWPRFCEASARLNRLLYKDNVESLMRTPSCAGLQLLSAQDFTGQFEAMIGWRDSFYDLKPAVKGLPPFRDVLNPMPHLARFGKYCWSVGETYKATLLVRNLTERPILEGTAFFCSVAVATSATLPNAVATSATLSNAVATSATLPNAVATSAPLPNADGTKPVPPGFTFRLARTINPGEAGVVGEVSFPLTDEMAGRKFTLKFGFNSWPFWVFGREGENVRVEHVERVEGVEVGACVSRERAVLETASFDEALAALAKGGKVLYTGPGARSARSHFKPVGWSAGHFSQADAELSSLGYLVQSGHPALRGFPTEDWADWQWHNLVEGGVKYGLAGLVEACVMRGRGVRGAPALPCVDPIVQPVPDLHYSTFMGMLFELKVGNGRLMVCGLNLSDRTKPEVNAMRASLLAYMASSAFNPSVTVEREAFKEAFAPRIPEAKRRPPEFADAPVYIAAAVELEAARKNVPWKPTLDMAEMKQGGYTVSGEGNWGVWRDASGFFWHGKRLSVTLTGTAPVNGTLHVRFRDPNGLDRSGRGTCEGRPFTVPKHQDRRGGVWWLEMPVLNEDALDGKIEFFCEALTGPNLMIDRVVLTADK